jgi:hypothetical protein
VAGVWGFTGLQVEAFQGELVGLWSMVLECLKGGQAGGVKILHVCRLLA